MTRRYDVHTVELERLRERIGALPRRRVSEAKRALGHALSWPELVVA